MYVAGSRSASRAAAAALRTCIRSWSTRKSGRPAVVERDHLAVDEQVPVAERAAVRARARPP